MFPSHSSNPCGKHGQGGLEGAIVEAQTYELEFAQVADDDSPQTSDVLAAVGLRLSQALERVQKEAEGLKEDSMTPELKRLLEKGGCDN